MPAKKINQSKAKPKLEIEYVPIKSIAPHPRNARIHDEDNLTAIMKSLKEFGQRTPLVLGGHKETRNLILKGCGTHEAMTRLKFSTVAIVRAQNMSVEDELAYSIADNKTSDTSEFDFEGVADILKFLDERKYDLSATGFADFEIEPLLEAEWDPGKESPMPGEDPNATAVTLKFNSEQYGILERAFELGVAANDFKADIQLTGALIKICEIYSWYHEKLGQSGQPHINPHVGNPDLYDPKKVPRKVTKKPRRIG